MDDPQALIMSIFDINFVKHFFEENAFFSFKNWQSINVCNMHIVPKLSNDKFIYGMAELPSL